MLVNGSEVITFQKVDISHYSAFDISIAIAFVIGLIGNFAALWILYKTAKRRNKKHLFMLRCLAVNDLVAQFGMLLVINLRKNQILPDYWSCVALVVMRAFGLGSGCVAFVMAFERWLALTRPFLYHQVMTYRVLKRFLFGLWLTAVTITYLPLFGFGLYYTNGECVRFRYAEKLPDKIYAYLFFFFGATLCICIVICNTCVIWELCRIKSQNKILVRRVSRSIINNRVGCARYQTPEEVAFAKFMAIVCIVFVVCWTPQIITVPVSQIFRKTKSTRFDKMADFLLLLYFMLDPFLYVLQNFIEGRLTLNSCGFKKSTSSISTNTTVSTVPNNTIQLQETIYITDNSV